MTNQIKSESFKAEFKPGTYFIGDPCYALREDLYEKWGDENNYDDGNYDYFAAGSTKYGDGTYKDDYTGREYGVDAGILGIVNMEYAADKYNEETLNQLGQIVKVEKSLTFEYNADTCTFTYQYDDNKCINIETEDLSDDEEEDYD